MTSRQFNMLRGHRVSIERILRDFPDQADSIAEAMAASPLLNEACLDYERLSNRLQFGSTEVSEAAHIEEILVELRSEILRLFSLSQNTGGKKPQ
jgi:hypothetical protein